MNPPHTPSGIENRSTDQELPSDVDPFLAYTVEAMKRLTDALLPRNILPEETVCPCGGLTYRDRETGVIGCRECGELHID